MRRRLIVAAVLAAGTSVALLGCTVGQGKIATSAGPGAPSAAGSPSGATAGPARQATRPVTLADARGCPVTIGHPVPLTKPWRTSMAGFDSAHGNAGLWVGALWPHGIVIISPDNVGGELSMKFGWYRLTSGYLTITGQRLDGSAPPASGQPSGYGLTGFNASSVIFPTEGCWQITGRGGQAALTFVTFVIQGHCDPIRCAAGRVR